MLQDNGGDNLSVTRERVVHVRDRAAERGAVQRDGEDEPVGADVHGLQRVGDGRVGQRDQVAVSCTTSTGGSYTVGGTVSGLSGTVVLQDNGGDNLSVSANGSFTFATALADGDGLSRDGEDEPVGADVHGVQRVGHGRVGQRHQRRGHLQQCGDLYGRRDCFGAVRDGGAAG